jgi:hypothetical protein
MALELLRTGKAGNKLAEFPPNPVEFRKLCLSYNEGLRLPSDSEAYLQLMGRSNRPHPAVQFTAKKLAHDFQEREDNRETYLKFQAVYHKVCHLVRMGHAFPNSPEPIFLEKPKNETVAKAHLRQIRQLLGASPCAKSQA